MPPNIYSYTHTSDLVLSGPISLVVGYLPEFTNSEVDSLEQAEQILNNNRHWYIETSLIQPVTLNSSSYIKSVNSRLDYLVSKLCWKLKLNPDNVIIDCQYINKSSVYVLNRTSYKEEAEEVKFLKKIANLLREDWILKHSSNWYPQFEWDSNLGLANDNHWKLIYKHGISYTQHHHNRLKAFPKWWYRKLRQFDEDIIIGQDLMRNPPAWWKHLFSSSFCEFLKSEEEKINLVAGTIDYVDFI